MNPVAAARGVARPATYKGDNRVPAALVLYLLIVGIAVARNGGKLPDQKHFIALGVMALIVVGAASFAPRVIFYMLLAAMLVLAFQNSSLVANYIDRGTAAARGALAGA